MSKLNSIILAFVLSIPFCAQAQVNVQLRQPPSYQLKVEDFWKVTLQNTSTSTYNVKLGGIATNAAAGEIVSAETKTFRLPQAVEWYLQKISAQ